MSKYKAVIFDFDDTLVESREIKWAHHRYVAKKFYNIDLSDETFLKHWGKPLHTLMAELYQHSDTPENMMKNVLSVREKFLKKVYDGSIEVVEEIINRGIRVGVLSATSSKFLLDDLTRQGFPVKEMWTQGSNDTEVHKPNGEVFRPMFDKLKEYNIEKKDIVYVGDSLIDLEATERAGIGFIAITTGLYSAEDFKKNGAKIIIKDVKEVLHYI